MFDLIAGKASHVPSTPGVPIMISTTVQASALAVIFVASFLVATNQMPVVPDVLAFVAEMPSAPPPPPAAPAPVQRSATAASKQAPTAAFLAPLEAPPSIELEPLLAGDEEEGVPGGVEGGIPSGVIGGIPGVVEGPPPPPPAPPARPQIARIGGEIKAPTLLHRVEPIYPAVAQSAGIDGVVILDAIVDVQGHVQGLNLLRGHPILAKAAIEAVKQWQYEPLLLNGAAAPFELTVSLWFHFTKDGKR